MPTYDYVCQACGLTVEVLHGVHAAGPSTCDACGGPLRKALSTPAIVFKGSGWAKIDARAKSAARPSTDKPPAADGDKSTTSTEKPSTAAAGSATEQAGSTSESAAHAD
jgi:putative FmdB family regulatory protein